MEPPSLKLPVKKPNVHRVIETPICKREETKVPLNSDLRVATELTSQVTLSQLSSI